MPKHTPPALREHLAYEFASSVKDHDLAILSAFVQEVDAWSELVDVDLTASHVEQDTGLGDDELGDAV